MSVEIKDHNQRSKTRIQSAIISINKILLEVLIFIILTILIPILLVRILNLDSHSFIR